MFATSFTSIAVFGGELLLAVRKGYNYLQRAGARLVEARTSKAHLEHPKMVQLI